MVIASATMSTLPSVRAGMRCAVVMTLNSILLGSLKMAFETALSISMSKPSIWPLSGLRAPSSRVSEETPAISRPRFWIVAMELPEAMAAPGAGFGPAGAKEDSGFPQVGGGGVEVAPGVGVLEGAVVAGTWVVA